MTSEQYIVKNCPAIYGIDDGFLCSDNNDGDEKYCVDCTDCVIKQVIEKCKERSSKCERCKAREDYQPTDCLDYCSNDDVIFAGQILQLFDIEEVKE